VTAPPSDFEERRKTVEALVVMGIGAELAVSGLTILYRTDRKGRKRNARKRIGDRSPPTLNSILPRNPWGLRRVAGSCCSPGFIETRQTRVPSRLTAPLRPRTDENG